MKNKIPIACIITDTHTEESNYEFVEKNIFEQFITYIKKINCKIAVHCGDWFQHRFPGTPLNSLLSVKNTIKRFHKEHINLFTLAGNHDKVLYESPASYIDVIEDCSPSLKYFALPGFYNLEDQDIRFAFLGYFKEGECYLSYLVDLIDSIKIDNKKKKRKTVLFTHTAINGVRNNDYTLVENDVEQDFFEFFDLILVGHYHNRSKLNDKIHYIGSDKQKDFGEDDKKGFIVLYSDLTFKYIQTTFPKFIKVPIRLENRKELTEKIIEYQDSNDKVRFMISGSQVELDSFDDSIIKNAGIEVRKENTVELLSNYKEGEEMESITHDKKSIIKNWLEYSDVVQLDSKQRRKGINVLQEIK